MTASVVDTNVGVAANGKADQAGPDCVNACIDALEEVVRTGRIVIDDGRRIIREYQRRLSPSGQPGVGDMFMKWVSRNYANPDRCEVVPITPKPHDPSDFTEIPNDPHLAGFDPNDRKFLAVAVASRSQPVVLNATDTRSWWRYECVLARHGVRVKHLCREIVTRSRISRLE